MIINLESDSLTPRLSGLAVAPDELSGKPTVPSKINFFDVKEFFFVNLDFQNERKNEFKDNNEK